MHLDAEMAAGSCPRDETVVGAVDSREALYPDFDFQEVAREAYDCWGDAHQACLLPAAFRAHGHPADDGLDDVDSVYLPVGADYPGVVLAVYLVAVEESDAYILPSPGDTNAMRLPTIKLQLAKWRTMFHPPNTHRPRRHRPYFRVQVAHRRHTPCNRCRGPRLPRVHPFPPADWPKFRPVIF